MNSVSIDISFIIPTYNVEKYIIECLDSIIKLRQCSYEIILIDDGSTDSTLRLISQYSTNNSFIKVITSKHLGAASARNKGLDIARGKWICFIDGDDFIQAEALDKCHSNLNEDIDIIFFDYTDYSIKKTIRHTNVNINSVLSRNDLKRFFLGTLERNYNPIAPQIIAPWAKLFKKDFLADNKLMFTQGIRKSHDVLFAFEAYRKANKAAYVHENVYYYRYNPTSLCNKYIPGVSNDYYRIEHKMHCILQESFCFEDVKPNFYFRCIANLMYSIQLDFCHWDNPYPYKKRKEMFLQAQSNEYLKEALSCIDFTKYRIYEKVIIRCIKNRWFLAIDIIYKTYFGVRKIRRNLKT